MTPFLLPGGSFSFSLSNLNPSSPAEINQSWLTLKAALDQFSQKVGTVVNNNQALSAPSAGRPTAAQLGVLPNAGVGWSMLDTTLGVPVWWNGTNFVDATGAPV